MTMRELAKLANVSVSTVSKAFAEADDVSEETKNHIFNIAKQYGCYGKFYKGKYSKKVIAIICPELAGNYYTHFIELLQGLIESQNGIAIISSDRFSATTQAELIEYYASYLKVDGIIVFGLRSKLKKGYDIPIVSIFSSSDDRVDSVTTDFKKAIFDSIEKLSELGHKKFAFLGETLTKSKAEFFNTAIKNTLGAKGICFESKMRFEQAGNDCINQLLNSNFIPTALICAYDNIAFGAIKRLKECGYSVPKDFSIIGIDNVMVSKYLETSLSSIDNNPEEICMIAWDLLSKKLKNSYYRSKQQIVVKSRLILRESVAKIK